MSLSGTEQPFVQHLIELRDRLLYSVYGIALAVIALAIWPGPNGLIDLIAQPIRKAHAARCQADCRGRTRRFLCRSKC